MSESVYTLGAWRVKPGQEAEFVEAWKEVSRAFAKLPMPPGGKGTLIQSVSDPLLFYSFGAWSSMEAVQAMRENSEAQVALQKLFDLCTERTPGTYRLVAEL